MMNVDPFFNLIFYSYETMMSALVQRKSWQGRNQPSPFITFQPYFHSIWLFLICFHDFKICDFNVGIFVKEKGHPRTQIDNPTCACFEESII